MAASLTARGGLLWLPVAGIVALSGRKRAAGHALPAAVVAMPLGHLVSLVVHRRRPHSTLPARLALPERPHSSSFPSKHAMTAVAFGTVIAVEDPPAGAFVTPLVLLVAYSRLRTRVHWPTDAIGGLGMGAVVGWAVRGVLRRKR